LVIHESCTRSLDYIANSHYNCNSVENQAGPR